MTHHERGLYQKYVVTKDGQPVEECFVLRPDRDRAARVALEAYAHATDNQNLRDDLLFWLFHRLSHDRGQQDE